MESKKDKPKRKKKKEPNQQPPTTAKNIGEAISSCIQPTFSKKINYEVLESLFDD